MYYIGIGASSGGQDALCEFFDHLPSNTDAAYFITTHLERSHRSQLDEIIQRHTAMHVIRVIRRMEIQPNVVYVQPENAALVFDGHQVLLKRRNISQTINRAINICLGSLAVNHRDKAIAIILSGTGDDGTNGILEISAHGGRVLVQDPHTTDYTGMPVSAIINDHPLAVCRPSDLAHKVATLLSIPDAELLNPSSVRTIDPAGFPQF